ncbi:MAG: alpha/beta hydrolase, partial [Actinomycetia bacterium]|nr:alpha/beta hydrolase [Actinomycetes bacterium]
MRQTSRGIWVLALLALVAGCGYLGGDDDPQGWPDVDFGVPVEVYRDHSIDDGRAAVAWIRTNADRLGIDPNRIALAGASAGGYLVTNADADPDTYVLFNPAVSAQVAARSEDAPTIVFHSRA